MACSSLRVSVLSFYGVEFILATFLELVGGLYSGSLAILTDAAHLLTDMSSFIISLVAIHLSERPGTVLHHISQCHLLLNSSLMRVETKTSIHRRNPLFLKK